MRGSETQQTWLQIGTIGKRTAEDEGNVLSIPVQTEVEDSELSTERE